MSQDKSRTLTSLQVYRSSGLEADDGGGHEAEDEDNQGYDGGEAAWGIEG